MLWFMPIIQPYTLRASLHHAWDGDTIWLTVDRGEGWWNNNKYRLHGVDTPEVRGKGVTDEEKAYAQEAKTFVEVNLALEEKFTISTHKGRSKYDWLAEIWVVDYEGEQQLLSERIIKHGHGVPYNGGTKLSWQERKAIQDAARAALQLP